MEQKGKVSILNMPTLAMAEVFSYLTFKDLYNAMLANSFFYASAKHYFASLYHHLQWDLLGSPLTKPHKAFLEIMRTRVVRIPINVSFSPLESSSLIPELAQPMKEFQSRGILYVKFSYDFSAVPGSFNPSAFCLTCGGTVLLYKLSKGGAEEKGTQQWKFISEIQDPRFIQIECSKSMCGVGKDGKVYDVLPVGSGFSNPIELTSIEGEVKQVGCTVKHHYALTQENTLYFWSPEDYVIHTVECPKKPIVQISCEANYVFILYEDYNMYVLDEQEEESEIKEKKAVQSPELTKLKINKIASGIVHSIAMSQEIFPPMEEWDNAQLVKWVMKSGFEDYANVIKYKKITGKDLQEADTQYLEDVLGLVDENLLQKFIKERSKYQGPTIGKTSLYGWGINHHGELASKANSCKYNNPLIIPLPELAGDNIQTLVCGFKTSALITSKGSLWVAGNVQALKKPEPKKPKPKKEKKKKGKRVEDEEDKEETQPKTVLEMSASEQVKEKKKRISKHKETLHEEQDKLEEYHQKLEIDKGLKHRWVNFDRVLDPVMRVNVKSITMSQRENIICYTVTKFTKDGKRVGKKFKGADKILKQIEWDERLKTSTFIIGYEDRFLGILEMAYADFVKSDVPIHRIQYIKKDGVVVWDRKTRLNKLT